MSKIHRKLQGFWSPRGHPEASPRRAAAGAARLYNLRLPTEGLRQGHGLRDSRAPAEGGLCWPYVRLAWAYLGAMLALCSPVLAVCSPTLGVFCPRPALCELYVGLCSPMLAVCCPRSALCWPMSALCWPYVGPSWPYLAPMLALSWPYVAPSCRQILLNYETPLTCHFFLPGPPLNPKTT